MKARRLNKRRERDQKALSDALWPQARVGEALTALARHAGLPSAGDAGAPSPDLEPERLAGWIDAAAEHTGVKAEQLFTTIQDVRTMVSAAPPVLLRLRSVEGTRFLAVSRGGHHTVTTIGPDLRVRRLSLATVCEAVRHPFEAPLALQVERLLDRLAVPTRRRERARESMLEDRLSALRFGGSWALRHQMEGGMRAAVREARLPGGVASVAAIHLAQSVLFVLSWWLLGRGLLSGTIDRGWLLGWLLLLLSIVPLQVAASWTQGLVAVAAGAALRRRLLKGTLGVERQRIRHLGAGQFFGVIVEAAAIESLALNGGVAAALAGIELSLAAVVLWFGAGILPIVLLAGLSALTGWAGWRYVTRRKAWTLERLDLTHLLLEHMIGHRTRLAQQSSDEWHRSEDALLERYSACAQTMDRWDLWLMTASPRGWLALSIAALAPSVMAGFSPDRLAVFIGGTLLAYRALRRLSVGLSALSGAVIAGRLAAPLTGETSSSSGPLSPSVVVSPGRPDGAPVDSIAVQARDLVFRYRAASEPVLEGCSLKIARGARVLLEGPSGSGKTTLVSLLAGVLAPDSGVVLADGLDRQVLGAAGWRSRVVMAPQPHDNYILGGSLAFNLLMGCRWPARDADLVQAEEVCRELGLGELLDRMPGGLHQTVGETGWQLSQGERTRVFLARALLQRPELLVLDESFSALDPENVDRALRCVQNRAPAVLAVAHT